MNLNSRITLAIRNFFRRYGKVILIIFIIWLALFLANQYIKGRPKKLQLQSSYNPDTPVMDDGEDVPKKLVGDINSVIDEYFNFCNNKDYEGAFNMLTTDCKEYLYENDINKFKNYVDKVFNNHKIYNLQNYSNLDNKYIYEIRIIDDISATGATGQYETYEEKITVHYNNGNYKISNRGYICKQEINKNIENDDIKVKIIKKEMTYSREEYTVEIRNKTDNYMMIMDDTGVNQITLSLGTQIRQASSTTNANIILLPEEVTSVTLSFYKYYDDDDDSSAISFNNVRLISKLVNTSGSEGNDIVRAYSLNIDLK